MTRNREISEVIKNIRAYFDFEGEWPVLNLSVADDIASGKFFSQAAKAQPQAENAGTGLGGAVEQASSTNSISIRHQW